NPTARPCREASVIASEAASLAASLPSAVPCFVSSGITFLTKSLAASVVVTPIRTAATARNRGPAMTTPTSWPRIRPGRARAPGEEDVEGNRQQRDADPLQDAGEDLGPGVGVDVAQKLRVAVAASDLAGDDDRGDHEHHGGQRGDTCRARPACLPGERLVSG